MVQSPGENVTIKLIDITTRWQCNLTVILDEARSNFTGIFTKGASSSELQCRAAVQSSAFQSVETLHNKTAYHIHTAHSRRIGFGVNIYWFQTEIKTTCTSKHFTAFQSPRIINKHKRKLGVRRWDCVYVQTVFFFSSEP